MLKSYTKSMSGQIELLAWLDVTLLAAVLGLLAASYLRWKLSGDFLSDAASFAAAVVSLSVPLGLDVLGRFSEKYGSNRPMRFFVPHLRIPSVVLSVFALVTATVVHKAGILPSLNMPLLWFNLLLFGIMATYFFWFLSAIVRFVVWEPSALIDEMARTIANETY